ncbi:RND family transporter [Myxococcota bacterium]
MAVGDDGSIAISPLVGSLPTTMEESDQIRRRALANSILTGGLVSEDARACAILIELDRDGADFAGKVAHVVALQEAAARELADGVTIRLTGTPPFDEAFYRLSVRDSTVLAPAALIVILLSVLLIFRRVSSVIIPVAVVAMALIWIYGLMAVLGMELNVLSGALAAVILAVGIADSIHVLADYYQELMIGRAPKDAVRQSILNLLVPCFFTSATTVVGMLSLEVSSLAPVQEFGALAALGVFFAFILSITFAPAVLALAKPPDRTYIERLTVGPISRLLGWLGQPNMRRSRIVLGATGFALVAAVWGWTHLEVGANTMNYFKKNSPVRLDAEAVDRALGGSATVEMLVTAPDEGLKDPAKLARLDELQRWLETHKGVTQSLSVVDSVKEMHRVLHDGDRKAFTLPDSRPLIAQLYLLLEGEADFSTVVQDNYSVGRITSRVQMTEAADLARDVPNQERRIAREFPEPDLQVELTGFVKLMHNMEIYLVQSQIRSLSIAFAVITVMLMLLLRSIKLGLFSMIPNILPVVLGLALMGTVGIDLDPGTIMIGAIALGLVVDDSVHFLVRLRRHIAGGSTLEAAIHNALQDAGRPIIITSLLLAGGFAILVIGSFSPNIHFGIVTAWVVMVALIADLVLLPAALLVIRPRL